MRKFESGATRDTDEGKFDYEGFLSPIVLDRFAAYMHENRVQADGNLRDSDNWQRGIPLDAYMKSMMRHFMDVWALHRGFVAKSGVGMEEALCAMMFNVMGMLFETMRPVEVETQAPVLRGGHFTGNPVRTGGFFYEPFVKCTGPGCRCEDGYQCG
jgi:hypothetical protein